MIKVIPFLLMLVLFVFLPAQNEAEAVIYDDAFEGKPTASGELFSQRGLTAAHASLPLGTRVELLHVTCNKRLVVTVTDRIQNAPGLFWISRAAADSLNINTIYPTGILYTVVDESYTPPSVSKEPHAVFEGLGPNAEKVHGYPITPQVRGNLTSGAAPRYGVQIYAALKRADAMELSRRLSYHIECPSYVERAQSDKRIVFRVIAGDFESSEEARSCYETLKYDFPESFIVEIY